MHRPRCTAHTDGSLRLSLQVRDDTHDCVCKSLRTPTFLCLSPPPGRRKSVTYVTDELKLTQNRSSGIFTNPFSTLKDPEGNNPLFFSQGSSGVSLSCRSSLYRGRGQSPVPNSGRDDGIREQKQTLARALARPHASRPLPYAAQSMI